MIKYILLLLTLSTLSFAQESTAPIDEPGFDPAVSTPVMTTSEEVASKDFNPKKSHWVTNFGFEGLKYELPWNYTAGQKKNFKERDQEYFGLRSGIGREFHIGKGFMTTTKLEGFFLGSNFKQKKTADPDIEDQEFAEGKRTGQIWGGDIVQSLSFQMDFSAKNPMFDTMTYMIFEPFIEAGIGFARAFNKINYDYFTTAALNESYRHTITDDLNTRKIGAGFNILANNGYFFFMKVTQFQFENTNRKQKGFQEVAGTFSDIDFKDENPDTMNVTAYSLGGGYKF